MRTTLTLDEDVAAFRQVVNDTLRRGLAEAPASRARAPFTVEARDLGRLRPGLSLDNIAELIEQVERPLHR